MAVDLRLRLASDNEQLQRFVQAADAGARLAAAAADAGEGTQYLRTRDVNGSGPGTVTAFYTGLLGITK